jgi:hypothetical protein
MSGTWFVRALHRYGAAHALPSRSSCSYWHPPGHGDAHADSGKTPVNPGETQRRSRLYDTTNRRYVSLAQLRQWTTEGVAFAVIDAATGADVTRVQLA